MSITHPYSGIEFDWFARDSLGHIAMFATAGEGWIPQAVLEVAEQHQEISNLVDDAAWGTKKVWDAYANLGLFVYDWRQSSKHYAQVRKPFAPAKEEFRNLVLPLPGLPRYPGRFQDCSRLGASWSAGRCSE